MTRLEAPIVWIDLEMTGLDVEVDTIIEFAVVVTDGYLINICKGPQGAIKTSRKDIQGMNEWCKIHHGSSGLSVECLKSKITIEDAESRILKFISTFANEGTMRLGGSSVHHDRRFMEKYFPGVVKYLHYGLVDVSSIRHVATLWDPNIEMPPKANRHRAMDDILESIAELQYLQKRVFGGQHKLQKD